MTKILLTVGLSLTLTGAAFSQASINECEKIQAADAYNRCLAKFGPAAKEKNLEPERPGDVKSSGAEAAATAPAKGRGKGRHAGRRRGGGGHAGVHRGRGHVGKGAARGGRKRMTIDVGK